MDLLSFLGHKIPKYDLDFHSRMAEIASGAYLTLKDISPKWYRRFEELPLPIFSAKGISWSFQMLFAETCVVGEAYGYSGSYINECSACHAIGYEFVTSFLSRSYDNLKENEEVFVKHWNQEHTRITERRKKKVKATIPAILFKEQNLNCGIVHLSS
jgi:hypothetical protein